jgi:beta-galactosidase/beta-glucuronidase
MSGEIRPEHPRPDWSRPDTTWVNLNGKWDFAFDDDDVGLQQGWWKGNARNIFDRKINVPFAHQTELSGVHDRQPHEVVWYSREVNKAMVFKAEERVLLHFGAVDYHATVWVNGNQVSKRGISGEEVSTDPFCASPG